MTTLASLPVRNIYSMLYLRDGIRKPGCGQKAPDADATGEKYLLYAILLLYGGIRILDGGQEAEFPKNPSYMMSLAYHLLRILILCCACEVAIVADTAGKRLKFRIITFLAFIPVKNIYSMPCL
jgi:hypothetical protein